MTVQVDARPDAVTFEPSTAAVVVVDMQHDFASRGGMFDRAGIDVSGIQAIVPAVERVLAAAPGLDLLPADGVLRRSQ